MPEDPPRATAAPRAARAAGRREPRLRRLRGGTAEGRLAWPCDVQAVQRAGNVRHAGGGHYQPQAPALAVGLTPPHHVTYNRSPPATRRRHRSCTSTPLPRHFPLLPGARQGSAVVRTFRLPLHRDGAEYCRVRSRASCRLLREVAHALRTSVAAWTQARPLPPLRCWRRRSPRGAVLPPADQDGLVARWSRGRANPEPSPAPYVAWQRDRLKTRTVLSGLCACSTCYAAALRRQTGQSAGHTPGSLAARICTRTVLPPLPLCAARP
jgi:hypothetical protein